MTFEGVDYRTVRTFLHVGMTEAEFQESVTQKEAERKRRLRAGSKDGEIWYSLGGMQRIRAERQAEH